ncbi:MAG: sulfatase-like hydrolase/transferase, partial [Acidobacteriota bacterium]|nr:sulfatase-like hydrolase/transferase [Acidobacteriota bacterium]
ALDARVFRRAFSSTSWTLPAHASLFSGMDLAGHRVLGPTDRLGEDYPLLAEVFQKNGFATAAFTGGGFVDDQYGFHRGFEVYSDRSGDVFLMDSAERVLNNFRRFADAAWGEDLFVFLHTYQAHAPYKFPARFKAAINPDLESNLLGPGNFLEDKRVECFKELPAAARQELLDLYDTAIFYADQALVGGVVDYVKKKGAYDEATIAVLSDHGEEFYDHGSWEHGHSLYNELIRIPLVIKFPRSRWRGTDDALTSIADIPSLLLKESGLGSPQGFLRDARKEKKRVLPVALPVSPIIKEIPAKVSFVDDRFHFIYNMIDRKALDVFVPRPPVPQAYEFYDRADEGETVNLAASRPQALKEFHARLAAYLRRLRDARGRERELDESLRRELKSLGYLND